MTFQGDTILGKPKLALLEIYIAEKGLYCDPQECYDFWESKDWKTRKGIEIQSLEKAVDVYNAIAVQKDMKKNAKKLGYTKLKKNDKKRAKRQIRKSLLRGVKTIDDLIIKEQQEPIKPQKEKKFVPYSEQLTDKKWLAFRKFVFAVRGNKCEKCGRTKYLQVHHPKYKSGRKAWEYTCNEVVVLCKKCHEKVHNITTNK